MATLYPSNSTYQNIGNAVQSVGRAASAARKSAKSFNTQKYTGVASTLAPAVSGATNAFTGALKGLKNLGSLTTQYGGSTNYEKFHPGVDIANKIGTPIPAYAGGTVVEAQSGKRQGDKGFGNTIVVQDAQGNKWRYSHLANEYVRVGQKIGAGTVLGQMGNTGSTYSNSGGTGSHLDLRIKDAYGKWLNPTSLL